MTLKSLLILLSASIFATLGQLLLKYGANGRTSLLEFFNHWVLLGLVFYGMGTIAWILMLSKESLTTVYAFTALTFVLVIFCGSFFFDERIDTSIIVGTSAILMGLATIVYKPF